MPAHLRALVVILGISFVGFLLAQMFLAPQAISTEDYRRRRNLWFAVTLIAFLSHSFWLYITIAGALLLYFGWRERNPMALYCLVLFTVPPIGMRIPGFGIVEHIIEITPARMLSIVLLLPAAIRLFGQEQSRSVRLASWLVAVYLLYVFIAQALLDSFTGTIRGGIFLFLDFWLPFYVASRSLRSLDDFREVIASLVLALCIVGLLAVFETMRSWILYSSMREALGEDTSRIRQYLRRGEGGPLRAYVTAGNSIVLGYLLMVGLGLLTALRPVLRSGGFWLGATALTAGLIAALSRGPWVGTVAMLLVILAAGPGAGRRIGWALAVGLPLLAILGISPYGAVIVDYLPFVGSVQEGNVTYRQRLLEISLTVLWQNPLFGSSNYLLNPLMGELEQSGGFIDMVNTYLVIALAHGISGLTLFLLPFLYVMLLTWKTHRRVAASDLEGEHLGRALMGVTVGILVTIATVSPISLVPTMYWLVLAFGLAYTALYHQATASTDSIDPSRYYVDAIGPSQRAF